MYNLSISNIANYGIPFIQNPFLNVVKSEVLKRVAVFAIAFFASLITSYLIIKFCFPAPSYRDPSIRYGAPRGKMDFCEEDDILVDPVSPKKVDPVIPPPKKDAPPKFTTPTGTSKFIPLPKTKQPLSEEQKRVKEIKQKWLENPGSENKRLLTEKVMTSEAQNRVRSGLTQQREETLMLLGRAIELKKFYKKDHYVFTHGQAPEVSTVNVLLKELVRVFTPALYHPLKTFFRAPLSVTYTENATAFVDKYNARPTNPGYRDNYHNAEMISVDTQLYNMEYAESCLDFTSKAYNINASAQLKKIFHSIFMQYIPNETIADMLSNKASKIAQDKKAIAKVGTLYAICIPKDLVKNDKSNFAYPCHPFGRECNCFPGQNRIELLESMQKNTEFKCKINNLTQYRLLTSRLTEEKEVRIFPINALSKKKIREFKKQIEELVAEARVYSLLYKIYEDIEQDPSVIVDDKMVEIDSLKEYYNIDENLIQTISSGVKIALKEAVLSAKKS